MSIELHIVPRPEGSLTIDEIDKIVDAALAQLSDGDLDTAQILAHMNTQLKSPDDRALAYMILTNRIGGQRNWAVTPPVSNPSPNLLSTSTFFATIIQIEK